MSPSQELHFVKPVWFGLIELSGDEVTLVDNLSVKETKFRLPEETLIIDVGATDEFVFFLPQTASPPLLYAFELRFGVLFRIDDAKQQKDEWTPMDVHTHHVQVQERNLDAASLSTQFAHWESFRSGGCPTISNTSKPHPHHRLLACTAFGGFLATHFENTSILSRIQDSRFDSASTSASSCSSVASRAYHLDFRVQKMVAGRDHLALLEEANGKIWMLGTGTRGELGNGHLDSGNWANGPAPVEALVESGIRCVDVQCGGWHVAALTDQGDVYGWGWNSCGQLGASPSEFSTQPTPYPFDLGDERAIAIRCAANSTFIRFADGLEERTFGETDHINRIKTMEGQQLPQTGSAADEQPKQQEQQKEECEAQPIGEQSTSVAAAVSEDVPEAKRRRQERMLNLAVAGCSHGQMDTIYERLAQVEQQRRIKFDLLVCCGDFQAIRNHGDLNHLHVPFHHRKLGTFYKYYSGEKVAPVLTLFIGGNHESSGYMAELPNGGWAAPNIYYMGYASVINFGGLRIAGLSGIFKPGDYNRGHFERPPFREHGSLISAYHVRSVDIFRLQQLKDSPVDIFVSHDWPAGIADFGDRDTLLRIKPHFTEDVMSGRLGNPATMNLLHQLKPSHWFAAHMHVHFTAAVPHHSSDEASSSPPITRFLALDKPNDNPRRRFLEFLQLPIAEDASLELRYDPEWLAILRATDELTIFTDKTVYMPSASDASSLDLKNGSEMEGIRATFSDDLRIPLNFQQTAPPETEPWRSRGRPASFYYRNPQSQRFCERLGIRDLNLLFAQASADHLGIPHFLSTIQQQQQPESVEETKREIDEKIGAPSNPDEINLDDEADEFAEQDFVVDVPEV